MDVISQIKIILFRSACVALFFALFIIFPVNASVTDFEGVTAVNQESGWSNVAGKNSFDIDTNEKIELFNSAVATSSNSYNRFTLTATSTEFYFTTKVRLASTTSFIGFDARDSSTQIVFNLGVWDSDADNIMELRDGSGLIYEPLYPDIVYTIGARYQNDSVIEFYIDGQWIVGNFGPGDPYDLNYIDAYVPTFNAESYFDYFIQENYYLTGTLELTFPSSGDVLRNDEWNDWEVLGSGITNWMTSNYLVIRSHTLAGVEYQSWDDLGAATTTSVIEWVVNNDNEFSDGLVISHALILGTQCQESLQDIMTGQCDLYLLGQSPDVIWTASSTGANKWELGLPFTFWPASTSEETHNAGKILSFFTSIFPLNILYDLYNMWGVAKNTLDSGQIDSYEIGLNVLVHEDYQSYTPSSTILLSKDFFEDNIPFWESIIYDSMIWIIWLITAWWIYSLATSIGNNDEIEI